MKRIVHGLVFAFAVCLAFVAFLGSSADAADVAFYFDSRYVSDDADLERISLSTTLGHTVTPFTGTSGTEWQNALATAEVVVVPEQSDVLFLALDSAARTALHDYVFGGGGLLVNLGNSRARDLLNGVFGFSTASAFDAGPYAATAATTGTPFSTVPATLPAANSVISMQIANLPAGTRAFYTTGTSAAAFGLKVGSGHIAFLGFDWSEQPAPAAWQSALDAAVEYVRRKTAPHALSYFADPAFVNLSEEGGRLLAAANSLGHDVTQFTGSTESAWSGALDGADVLLLPAMSVAPLVLDDDAKMAVADFVRGGGVLVANHTDGGIVSLLNDSFGWSLLASGAEAATSLVEAEAVATLFAGGPVTLADPDDANPMDESSLPAGAKILYQAGASVYAFAVSVGGGHVVWTAYNWFDAVTPQDWLAVLGAACGDLPARAVFPSDASAAGVDRVVTIDVTDEGAVSDAQIHYREGGTSSFASSAMTEVAPSQWSATLPASVITARGAQYYVELTDGFGTSTWPRGAPDSNRFASAAVSVTNVPIASLDAGIYQLVGVPIQPDDADPLAVFDEFGGTYDPTLWRYGTFDPLSSQYLEPGSGAVAATPGQGFWLIAKDAAATRVSGTTTDLSGDLTVTLSPGFNQIANPYNFPIDAASVVLSADVEPNFMGWDGTGYVDGVTTLQPGGGYWIKNNGALTTIRFPAVAAGVSRAAVSTPAVLADDFAWSAELRARAGAYHDGGNRFGMRSDATEARDAFDFSDPPEPMSGFVSVAFVGRDGERLLCDYRSQSPSGDRWDAIVRSDQVGRTYRVEVELQGELPDGFEWVAIEGDGGSIVDLREDAGFGGRVSSTVFQTQWTIAAGPRGWVDHVVEDLRSHVTRFALTSPRPNPARRVVGVALDFDVPHETEATVEIFDVRGRRVRTLIAGPLVRGVHHLYWDGTEPGGRHVASGVYFVVARASEYSQTRKVTVLE